MCKHVLISHHAAYTASVSISSPRPRPPNAELAGKYTSQSNQPYQRQIFLAGKVGPNIQEVKERGQQL